MRISHHNGYLVVRSRGRTTRYRLPSLMHLAIVLLIGLGWFLETHRPITSQLGQAMAGCSPRHLAVAARLCSDRIGAEAINIATVTRPPRHSLLPEYRLEMPANTLLQMHGALRDGEPALNHSPAGNKPYFKCRLFRGSEGPLSVRVCFRGTMDWHHRPEKPSFRVRMRKSDTGQEDRFLELTTLEDPLGMINWLPMQLAGELGL